MPEPNEAISSARVSIFLLPPLGDATPPLPPGTIESFRPANNYRAELLGGIGDASPTASVHNYVEGEFQATLVFQLDNAILDVVRPRITRFIRHKPFDMMAIDRVDNKQILSVVQCRVSKHGVDLEGGPQGKALRVTINGVAWYMLTGAELLEAA